MVLRNTMDEKLQRNEPYFIIEDNSRLFWISSDSVFSTDNVEWYFIATLLDENEFTENFLLEFLQVESYIVFVVTRIAQPLSGVHPRAIQINKISYVSLIVKI